jgi:hypothetical protein
MFCAVKIYGIVFFAQAPATHTPIIKDLASYNLNKIPTVTFTQPQYTAMPVSLFRFT